MTGVMIFYPEYKDNYLYEGVYMKLWRALAEHFNWRIVHDADVDPDKYKEDIFFLFKIPQHESKLRHRKLIKLSNDRFLFCFTSELHHENKSTLNDYFKAMYERADLIFSPCKEAFEKMNPELVHKFRWLPHYIDEEIYKSLPFNKNPKRKCLLSGAICAAYPIRVLLRNSSSPLIDWLPHPGYSYKGTEDKNDGFKVAKNYAQKLNEYLCVISTSSIYHYALRKYLEVPASGALLLGDTTEDLILMGFEAYKHYIPINKSNVLGIIHKVVANPDEYEQIRRQGRELVFQRHTVTHRFKEMKTILEEYINGRSETLRV